MNHILDTNAFLWLVTGAKELPDGVRQRLESDPEKLGVPAAVLIELACKERIGRKQPQRPGGLRFPVPFRQWIAAAWQPDRFDLLPIVARVAAEAFDLPGDFHADPYDCLNVATARLLGLPLVTSDTAIRDYPEVNKLYFQPRRPETPDPPTGSPSAGHS